MAKVMFKGNDATKPRQPTKAESNAANEAAFGPSPVKAKAKPKAPRDTPMVRKVRTFERQTAMY